MTLPDMPPSTEAGPSDYDLPRPSKIKLKETKSDKAARLYRREQRRYQRDAARISRANGYAVSPPRGRSESISPPRKRAARTRSPALDVDSDEDGDEGSAGYKWMGGHGDAAVEARRKREEAERMDWLIQEEMSRADPFNSIGFGYAQPTPTTHVPARHRHQRAQTLRGKRDPSKEVQMDGGPVPDIASMNEEEYTTWIREGMWRKTHREEVEERERQKRRKEEKERQEELERERVEKEERRRIRRLERQKGRDEEDRLKDQRMRYRTRWARIGEIGGDIEEANLAFEDIPWPIYHRGTFDLDTINKDTVRTFMQGVAADGGAEEDLKKVLRDAIRAFHPDRFFGRILPRVREADWDMVKEGVEVCSRVINDLAAEHRG